MNATIYTNNNYLKLALFSLINKIEGDLDFYILDLDSCNSLHEILRHIVNCEDRGIELYLIGGRSIYAELFSCFDMIDINLSLDYIQEYLNGSSKIKLSELKDFIASCRMLEQLTLKQINICLLDRMRKTHIASEIMNLNISSIYRNLSRSVELLNFKSLLNFRLFIMNEFTDDDLALLI